MSHIPPPPPVMASDYAKLAAAIVAAIAVLAIGIPAFFWVIAHAGDFAMRHRWL